MSRSGSVFSTSVYSSKCKGAHMISDTSSGVETRPYIWACGLVPFLCFTRRLWLGATISVPRIGSVFRPLKRCRFACHRLPFSRFMGVGPSHTERIERANRQPGALRSTPSLHVPIAAHTSADAGVCGLAVVELSRDAGPRGQEAIADQLRRNGPLSFPGRAGRRSLLQ